MNRRSFLCAVPVAGVVAATPALAASMIPNELAVAISDHKEKYKALSDAWEIFKGSPHKGPVAMSAEYYAYWDAKEEYEQSKDHLMMMLVA